MEHRTDKYRERNAVNKRAPLSGPGVDRLKLCQRYTNGLKVHDSVKLGQPQPLFRGAGESQMNTCENPNRSYTWTCAVCHRSTTKLEKKRNSVSNISLINAFNVVKEKLEVVIKMHIPKLCNDITLLKSITERISKQNEELIQKINVLKGRHVRCKAKVEPKRFWSQNYRKRKVLTYKGSVDRNKKDTHIYGIKNRSGHCRVRKRPHLIHRIFLIFNRKRNIRVTKLCFSQ